MDWLLRNVDHFELPIQLVLSRGQRLDWFESTEIVLLESLLAGVAIWGFITHSLTAKQPFLNPRYMLNGNHALGLLLVTVYGIMLNFTLMVLLPPLLREHISFSEHVIGVIAGFRSILGGAVGFLLAGFASRLDPRLCMMTGFGMLFVAPPCDV